MDSWEEAADTFVPTIPKANWDDDEEDETLKEEVVVPVELTAAQKALIKKKQEQEERTLANKVKNAQLENETVDERKIRERKAVEEADGLITDDLFDNIDSAHKVERISKSATGGIAAIKLSSVEDHKNFGITVATKLEKSTPFFISAFMKEVIERTKDKYSAEGLDELHSMLTKLKDSRKIADDAKNKNKGKTASQKAAKAKAKEMDKRFGKSYHEDEFEDFSRIEDKYQR